MVSRWVNNHQQPSDFYRDLLAQTLGRPRAVGDHEIGRVLITKSAEASGGARGLVGS
jgi:hypothetical protein